MNYIILYVSFCNSNWLALGVLDLPTQFIAKVLWYLNAVWYGNTNVSMPSSSF